MAYLTKTHILSMGTSFLHGQNQMQNQIHLTLGRDFQSLEGVGKKQLLYLSIPVLHNSTLYPWEATSWWVQLCLDMREIFQAGMNKTYNKAWALNSFSDEKYLWHRNKMPIFFEADFAIWSIWDFQDKLEEICSLYLNYL